ncbi:MAG: 3-deoxy-7-phosphoheptulonate synthase [Deltaproteobacteria bacterium]|nr:3-deoxy-7-phosphoheptulonate synthase [Deltaproteobacteria bacterium]
MVPRVTRWDPSSWKGKPNAQAVAYADEDALDQVVERLRALPPLVTSWEIERLKSLIADAQEGKRFLLQGGDCAETVADCRQANVVNKLKILLKMSLVLILGGRKPIVRVGRFAGQYAKPRSSPTEVRSGVELPSYFGDLVNRAEFEAEARRPDPQHLLTGYQHAAMTLNLVRALSAGGFADLHHPEYWDLSFFESAGLTPTLREDYQLITRQLADALRFMEALGEGAIEELSRVEFYASHEGLHLHYESAQTSTVPFGEGFYDLTTHLPWIGERTRALDGAHVEFFRGIKNPIGIKLGPKSTVDDVHRLLDVLNPSEEPGRIVLITRMGAERAPDVLPPLLSGVKRRVLWVCDPMHGNTHSTATGIKTRSFDAILGELQATFDAHAHAGTILGGVHFELTGDDVTECVGGAAGITESDLARNYESLCDPRLNQAQALEMAFLIARRMRAPSGGLSDRPRG